MKSYFVRTGLIPENCLLDYELAKNMMQYLNDEANVDDYEKLVRCHEVVRLFKHLPQVRCNWRIQDGYFGRVGTQHSWLWTHDTEGEVVILDIYPVATVDPILCHASRASPWGMLYIESQRSYPDEQISAYEKRALDLYEQQFVSPEEREVQHVQV